MSGFFEGWIIFYFKSDFLIIHLMSRHGSSILTFAQIPANSSAVAAPRGRQRSGQECVDQHQ